MVYSKIYIFSWFKRQPNSVQNYKLMYKNIWHNCHSSICCLNFINKSGIRSNTATGFKVGSYIITDDYSYKQHEFSAVEIFFVYDDGLTVKSKIDLNFHDFKESILNGAFEEPTGFSVLKGDYQEFESIPSLSLCKDGKLSIGEQTALLGFQFDHQNLCLKTGNISALFNENGRHYIEVDSTLRYGYSGSPLINLITGKVIGMIGHRLEGMAKTYNQMMKIINDNLKTLKEGEGKINIQDIDPIQVLVASQNQIKLLAKEFYKSADIRTGFALTINHIITYFEEMAIDMNIPLDDISSPCR
jgi:hypothetical protein